nr:hypothetical protein [uncultured Butyrivibrio sp.]
MDEERFYRTIDTVEKILDSKIDKLNGYFPTISEIENANVMKDLDTYLPIITYFAEDPYANTEQGNLNEYKATVKYCKDILAKVPLN